MMDFVDNLFVVNADEPLTNDVDFEEADNCVNYFFKSVFDVIKCLFDSLVQEDYFNPCAYGDNVWRTPKFLVDPLEGPSMWQCGRSWNLEHAPDFWH